MFHENLFHVDFLIFKVFVTILLFVVFEHFLVIGRQALSLIFGPIVFRDLVKSFFYFILNIEFPVIAHMQIARTKRFRPLG